MKAVVMHNVQFVAQSLFTVIPSLIYFFDFAIGKSEVLVLYKCDLASS